MFTVNFENLSNSNLVDLKNEIIENLKNNGFICLKNVPDFVKTYENFLKDAKNFVSLEDAEKNNYTPQNSYAYGWSSGIESFNGIVDTHKGSYYADIPDVETNIWPNESFKESYLNLGNIIFEAGKKLLSFLFSQELLPEENIKNSAKGRMLHYARLQETQSANNFWCGKHFDHGLFTGLTPGRYFKNNESINKPDNSGLHIVGKPVTVPDDVIIFQVGEVLQLLSNNEVSATEHWVNKAYDNIERYAFACFFELNDNVVIKSSSRAFVDRFDPLQEEITYSTWCQRSYAKYNANAN